MTTVGYGDVSAPDAAGQFVSCVLMVWSTFFLLPVAVVNVFNGVVKDRDKFTDDEQELLKAEVSQCREMLRTLTFRLTGETFK